MPDEVRPLIDELRAQLETHNDVRFLLMDGDGNSLLIPQDVSYDGELDEIVVELELYG